MPINGDKIGQGKDNCTRIPEEKTKTLAVEIENKVRDSLSAFRLLPVIEAAAPSKKG